MTFQLLHTNYSFPKCQAVKLNLFALWYKGPSFLPSRKSSTSISLRKSTHHQSCSIYGKLSPIGRHPVVLALQCLIPSYTFWSQPATTDCGCYGARTTNRCICLYARGGDARATRHGIYSTRMRLWSDCFLFGLIESPQAHRRSFLKKVKYLMHLAFLWIHKTAAIKRNFRFHFVNHWKKRRENQVKIQLKKSLLKGYNSSRN